MPYPEAAHDLFAAGYAPLPLPAGCKSPPPDGWTGARAPWPSYADVTAWTEDPDNATANTAARLAEDVIGLDVDAYDGKPGASTVRSLIVEHGTPPPTWVVSSRTDGVSGIRLYRLPESTSQDTLVGGLPGLDVIRHGHRYVVAPGSVHPSGAVYRCRHAGTGEDLDCLPKVADLPVLPDAWVEALSKAHRVAEEAAGRHRALTEGHPCQALAAALSRALEGLAAGGSRHDATVAATGRLLRLGDQGHTGAGRALDELRAAYLEAVAEPRRAPDGTLLGDALPMRVAAHKYADMIRSGLELIDRDPTPEPDRRCCDAPTLLEPSSPEDRASRRGYLDWPGLWADDDDAREYLIPGLWTVGASGSIYSAPGAGKSLLGLEWAVDLSLGLPILSEPITARTVLYLDHENDRRLVRERLEALGHEGLDLPRLSYSLLGDWAPLDTAQGGRELVEEATRLGAEVVFIDTTSRVVEGEENAADTFLSLFRHTLRPLKAAGIAVVRFDHTGKDATRGERGSSAKRGDVDLAYLLVDHGAGLLSLRRQKNRLHLEGEEEVTLRRETEPLLRHVPATVDTAKLHRIEELVAHLDALRVPATAGRRKAAEALRKDGSRARNADVAEAQRRRSVRVLSGPNAVPEPNPAPVPEMVPDRSPSGPQAVPSGPPGKSASGPHRPHPNRGAAGTTAGSETLTCAGCDEPLNPTADSPDCHPDPTCERLAAEKRAAS